MGLVTTVGPVPWAHSLFLKPTKLLPKNAEVNVGWAAPNAGCGGHGGQGSWPASVLPTALAALHQVP